MDVEIVQGVSKIIRVNGEIDYSNAGVLESALQTATRESPNGFVVDMTEVTYLDSAGIQVLLGTYRQVMNTGGKIYLVISHPNVKEIFTVINMQSLPNFYICESMGEVEEALSKTQRG